MSTDIHVVAPSAQESPAEEYWLQLLHGFEDGIAEQYVVTDVSQDGSVIFAIDTYDATNANMRMPVGRITRDGILTFGDYGVWSPYWITAVEDGLAFTALDDGYAHSAIFRLDKFNRLLWAKQHAGAEYSWNIAESNGIIWILGFADTPGVGCILKVDSATGAVQNSWDLSHAGTEIRVLNVCVVGEVMYVAYVVLAPLDQDDMCGIIAMTTAGVKLWDRAYKLTAGWTMYNYYIQRVGDYLYVDGGRFNPWPSRDFQLLKIRADTGELVWAKRLVTTPNSVSSFSTGIASKDEQIYVGLMYMAGETGFTTVIKITPTGDVEWQQALSKPSDPTGAVGGSFQIAATQSEGFTVSGMDYDSSGVYLPFLGHLPIRPDGPMTFGDYVWEDHPLDYPFVDITADFTVTADYLTVAPAAYVLEDFVVPPYLLGLDHREIS